MFETKSFIFKPKKQLEFETEKLIVFKPKMRLLKTRPFELNKNSRLSGSSPSCFRKIEELFEEKLEKLTKELYQVDSS